MMLEDKNALERLNYSSRIPMFDETETLSTVKK